MLKAAITNEIAGNPWHRIKETCARLDLASIPNEESLNKPSYVSARLEATPAERHFDIAMRLHQERPDAELRRAIIDVRVTCLPEMQFEAISNDGLSVHDCFVLLRLK